MRRASSLKESRKYDVTQAQDHIAMVKCQRIEKLEFQHQNQLFVQNKKNYAHYSPKATPSFTAFPLILTQLKLTLDQLS